jgi:hypothetical protein
MAQVGTFFYSMHFLCCYKKRVNPEALLVMECYYSKLKISHRLAVNVCWYIFSLGGDAKNTIVAFRQKNKNYMFILCGLLVSSRKNKIRKLEINSKEVLKTIKVVRVQIFTNCAVRESH